MERKQDITIMLVMKAADMIDLHTHILPYMDDGAKDMKEAHALIEMLYQQEIEIAVCTPHFNPVDQLLGEFVKKRKVSMDMLADSKITLVSACELFFHNTIFFYQDITELCINDTRYVLIEFPVDMKWNKSFFTQLERFIRTFDVIPIIAHIERYKKCRIKSMLTLKKLGCIIQMNTTSIIEKKKKKRALTLIKRNLIDVLGSDCHNITSRYPVFLKAVQVINKNLGEEYSINLLNHSKYILQGVDIRPSGSFQIG